MSFLAGIQSDIIAQKVTEHQQVLDPLRQLIFDHFGQNGLYAAYFLAVAIAALILYKLVKLSFDLIFFVALPAIVIAFILALFLPYSFFYLLPVTTALFTLGLVLRNVGFSKG